jgi:hypothetical protein
MGMAGLLQGANTHTYISGNYAVCSSCKCGRLQLNSLRLVNLFLRSCAAALHCGSWQNTGARFRHSQRTRNWGLVVIGWMCCCTLESVQDTALWCPCILCPCAEKSEIGASIIMWQLVGSHMYNVAISARCKRSRTGSAQFELCRCFNRVENNDCE